ncbi:MAG: S-layer homology domain-containing protein, partial [bacterium]
MKRIALFLALVLAVVFSVPAIAAPFPDVPSNHWAYDAVNELASKGLILGYPDGTFRGNNPMTRYELAMVISRLVSYLEKISGGPSVDVSQFVTKGELANTLANYVTTDQLADYVTVDQLADYVTTDQLADYVTTDQLANYVTTDQLSNYVTTDQLSDYVTFDALADYVTTDQLANYVTTDQLSNYVTTDQLA